MTWEQAADANVGALNGVGAWRNHDDPRDEWPGADDWALSGIAGMLADAEDEFWTAYHRVCEERGETAGDEIGNQYEAMARRILTGPEAAAREAAAEARGAERALREMVAQFDVRGDYLGTQIVDALNAARVANGAVTSIEPGCTCGGVAACEQCQARDYVDADLDPDLPHLLAEARRAHPEGDS